MQGDDEFVVRIECTVGPGGLSDFRGEGEGSIMATITWIKSMLDRRGIAYEERHHRAAFSAQEVAQSEHISGHRVAKVVVALADGRPVELILPASRRVALDRLKELLVAEEVRLASEAEMGRIFGDCETGAIPPLRHWKDVAVLMDASMPDAGDLVFQAGTHEDAIRLNVRDWLGLVEPLVGSFSEPEHAAIGREFTDRGDVGGPEWEGPAEATAEEARRECGLPGGGKGRIEILEPSGVYPGSGPYPEGEAELRTPAEFVRGQVDEQGREVEGGSGPIYEGGILLGGETPPPSSPPTGRK
jgi:Ala-tRNA(Pro) deacylase